MRQFLTIILFILYALGSFAQSVPPATALPSTEVYLINIQKKGDVFTLADTTITNISKNKGYDNQPVFIDELYSVAYVSERNNKATDVYLYHLNSSKTTQFTYTNEAEYSPKVTPDGKYISVVKGAEQNLTRISLDGSVTEKIYTCKDSIGYYCWVNENEIAAVVLTKPISLKLINIKNKTEKYLNDSAGRSLFMYNNMIVYCRTGAKGNEILFSDTTGNIKDHLELTGTEDFYITEDGWIFSSNGSSIVYCNAQDLKKGWQVLADLKKMGIPKIFRISVNTAENKLAFVAEGE